MPTPSKPYTVLAAEGKSHRTKKELRARRDGEAAMLTGKELKERKTVRDKPEAHKEFMRIKGLLKEIGKNDALYESVINRYCQIMVECTEMECKRERVSNLIGHMEKAFGKMEKAGEIEYDDLTKVIKELTKLSSTLISYDRQVQAKRKMLLDIEKENIMTIAAALRSVPKKDDRQENPLLKALNGG